MIDKDRIYTIREAASLTRYSVSTLRRLIELGKIKKIAAKERSRIKIWGDELLKFLGRNVCE